MNVSAISGSGIIQFPTVLPPTRGPVVINPSTKIFREANLIVVANGVGRDKNIEAVVKIDGPRSNSNLHRWAIAALCVCVSVI